MGAPSVISDAQSLSVSHHTAEEYCLVSRTGKIETRIRVRLEQEEHGHRLRLGVGAITSEIVLGALLEAQPGTLEPVDPRFMATMCAPSTAKVATVIRDPFGGYWASAQVSNPLEILEVEICSDRWEKASNIAHDWAGYASRTVRLPSQESVDPFTLSEASLYGIGVAYEHGESVALLPERFAPTRWSSARWLVSELLYDALLRSRLLSH